MTEEIIIDGVNVSDCRLRQYNSDLCNGFKMDNSGFHQGHCCQNPNCYYKQLQRLEQENKELRKEIAELRKDCNHCNFHKYRSALEEIRKLTVIGVNASQCNCGLRALADDILNKINEVLNYSKC